MEKQIVSACGNICSECPRYVATQSNDMQKLEYLSELWYRLGYRDKPVRPEELKCNGCADNKDCTYGINQCAKLESKRNCGECRQFPCHRLEKVFEKAESYKKAMKNKCTEEEYKILSRAFLLKRENLVEIHKKFDAADSL